MAQAHGENLKQALDTLRAHKLRSALTVFGVVLGVSVIMIVTVTVIMIVVVRSVGLGGSVRSSG